MKYIAIQEIEEIGDNVMKTMVHKRNIVWKAFVVGITVSLLLLPGFAFARTSNISNRPYAS